MGLDGSNDEIDDMSEFTSELSRKIELWATIEDCAACEEEIPGNTEVGDGVGVGVGSTKNVGIVGLTRGEGDAGTDGISGMGEGEGIVVEIA